MKRCFFFCLFLWLLLPIRAQALEAPAVSARSMILLHADSGEVLAQKDAELPLPMASTTKIMTALVALEHCDLAETVTIEPAWTGVEGSSMYLRPGDQYTVEELLYGLLLCSGNDAATALAAHAAGDVETFVGWMNEKAEALGLKNTRFANPHGLPAEGHWSTAADLAAVMAEAMRCEPFRRINGAQTYSTHGVTLRNHNKLLALFDGVNGGKTGFTKASGRCLVSSCTRDGLSLICVTLSAPDDWNDHIGLYAWAYGSFHAYCLHQEDTLASVPVIGGERAQADAVPEQDVCLCLPNGEEPSLTLDLPRFVYAPVTAGQPAGRLRLFLRGALCREQPLCWAADIPAADNTE